MLLGIEGIPNNVKKIVVFGCTEYSIELVEKLQRLYADTEYIYFDNNYAKKTYRNIEVRQPCCIGDAYYVVASVNYYSEMIDQLLELEVSSEFIVLPEKINKKRELELKRIIAKRIPQKKILLAVDLAEHCNLNCQNCDHFSPLAKEKYATIDEFTRDIKQVAELFGGNGYMIEKLGLEGGEPLLNKDIVSFVEVARKLLPKSEVCIYTNGILLLKQSEEFWQALNKYRVILKITKYPIKIDYDEIIRQAIKFEVKWEFFSGGDTIKESMHKPLDLSGSNDKYDSFHKCYMGNGMCTMLKHGRIYPCTVVPNIEHFNAYFDKNVEVCERDSIDIYKVDSAEEILDFLANPIPACRYCQPDKWTCGHKWKTTTYEMSEWAE